MAFPPLCTAILVVKETSSSVTAPPTKQGPCSGSARPEMPSKAIAKTSGPWSAGAPKNRPKYPKEGLGKRRPRSPSATAERTRFRGFQHSWWRCGTDEGRPGVATRPRCRELLRERQKVPHRENVSLSACVGFWLGGRLPGEIPHTRSRGLASAKRSLPVLLR